MNRYVYRKPWDYYSRRKAVSANRPKTATNITPSGLEFVPPDHLKSRESFRTRNNTNRRLLTPTLSRFKPPTTSSDIPQSVLRVERRESRRTLQQPLWLAPQGVVASTAVLPAFLGREASRRPDGRRTPVHPVLPPEVTLADATPAVPPAHNLPVQHTRREHRKVLEIEPLPPVTTAATLAAVPGALFLAKPFRLRHERKLLVPTVLNVHPATGTSSATVAAFVPAKQVKRLPRGPVVVSSTVVISDNRTAATAIAPSYFPVAQHKRTGWRKVQRPLALNTHPTETRPDVRVWRDIDEKVVTLPSRRALRVVPIAELLNDRTKLPSPFPALGYHKRSETDRELLVSPVHNEYPQTPVAPVVFAALDKPLSGLTRRTKRRVLTPKVEIYTGYPSELEAGNEPAIYVTAAMPSSDVYVSGAITEAVYLLGGEAEVIYLLSSMVDNDLYTEGEILDAIYTLTDFNL